MSGEEPRVLFVDHVGVLGGAELSLLDLAARLPWRRRVLLFDDGPFAERLGRSGVPFGVLRARRSMQRVSREGGILGDLAALPALASLAFALAREAREYDVLYANSQKAFLVSALAGFMSRRPVIWHLRDVLSEEHFSGWHRRLLTLVANLMARLVITNSRATTDAFVASGGRVRKVRTVHNGVDARAFDEVTSDEVQKLKEALRIDGHPIVGVFSRLSHWKGQHVLLDMLPGLPGVQALIVGDALFGEVEYASALRDRARRLGVEDRVRFLGHRADIPLLMRACDVVLHTSVAPEPFGRVLVEGMLAGRPVVAAAGGGVAEIVQHADTGWLVPGGDPQRLGEMVSRLLDDPAAARDMGARGRQRAREHFSVEQMVERVQEAILGVVRPRHDAAARPPVTVTILAKNEERFIERAIRSASWADEVLVLDSGSTDDTRRLATALGATVYDVPWLGFSAQHNKAAELARHDWIFAMDADEIVTPRLRRSLQRTLRGRLAERNGYSVVRRSDFHGVLLPNMQRRSKRSRFVRLFNRRVSAYDVSMPVHEEVRVPGRLLRLDGPLVSWRGLKVDDMVHSLNSYATVEARVLAEAGVRANAYHLGVRPIMRFLWCYVARGSFRAGSRGLGYAVMKATSEYVRYAKLWEMQHDTGGIDPAPELLDRQDGGSASGTETRPSGLSRDARGVSAKT